MLKMLAVLVPDAEVVIWDRGGSLVDDAVIVRVEPPSPGRHAHLVVRGLTYNRGELFTFAFDEGEKRWRFLPEGLADVGALFNECRLYAIEWVDPRKTHPSERSRQGILFGEGEAVCARS